MEHYKKKITLVKDIQKFQKFLVKINETLKIFLGPFQKNCINFETNEISFLTNGLNFLKHLNFFSNHENLFLKLFEQASLKTFNISSKGTTLTAFFSTTLLLESLKFLSVGYNSIFLSNGFTKIAYFSIERLSNYSIEITKFSQLKNLVKNLLTKNNKNNLKKIEKFLSLAIGKFRKETNILIENNIKITTEVEFSQGIEIENGFLSTYFINDFKNFQIYYKNPYILICNFSMNSLLQLKDVISFCKSKNRALIIVTEGIEKKLLSHLILMSLKKQLKVAVIKYTSIKFLKDEFLNDLSILTHSCLNTEKNKIFSAADLGNAEKIVIKKNKSFFSFSKFSKLIALQRTKELTRNLLRAETVHEKENLKIRISRLSANLIKLKIDPSSTNKYENNFLKEKMERALETLRSSFEEGILPGGTAIYSYYSKELLNWSFVNLLGDEFICSKIVDSLIKLFSLELQKSFKKIFLKKKNSEKKFVSYNNSKKRVLSCFKEGFFDCTKTMRGVFWNSLNLVSTILKIF